jgi:hypothetical protein
VSDTPRTDAAAIRCACSTYVVPSEFARELERENAALRADKERLDWIAKNRSVSVTERPLAVTPDSLRVAIDAVSKEEQP